MRLELFLTEHIAVDAFGVEQRAFAALVTLLDILPGLVLHLVGHAPPGTPCSKLEPEAVAIDWAHEAPRRAGLAGARALMSVAEALGGSTPRELPAPG